MVRPLKTCSRAGRRYARPTAVEDEIAAALSSGEGELLRRISIRDTTSLEYLRTESLVYFLREARRSGDEVLQNSALEFLLGRCEKILDNTVRNSLPHAQDVREEALSAFSELLANDGTGERPDELDYYECRFNSAFAAFRNSVLRRENGRLTPLTPLPGDVDEQGRDYGDAAGLPLLEVFQVPPNQMDAVFRRELRDAINGLPPDEREALVLCYLLRYNVESENPDETTAATLCRCTGRTIRNRLARAAARLSHVLEDACTPT